MCGKYLYFLVFLILISNVYSNDVSLNFIIPTVCGDGHCILGENCATCEEDCGVCPTSGPRRRGGLPPIVECQEGPVTSLCLCNGLYMATGICDYGQDDESDNDNLERPLIPTISINLEDYSVRFENATADIVYVDVFNITSYIGNFVLDRKNENVFDLDMLNDFEPGEYYLNFSIFDGEDAYYLSKKVLIEAEDAVLEKPAQAAEQSGISGSYLSFIGIFFILVLIFTSILKRGQFRKKVKPRKMLKKFKKKIKR